VKQRRRPFASRDFSLYLFFFVFWLTVIATILVSWQMVVSLP
jgi:hypothetical protein